MKLVCNLVVAANMIVACEGLSMGAKAGIDPARMLELLNSGTARSAATSDILTAGVLERRFAFGARTSIIDKDVRLGLREAQALGAPAPVIAAAARVWKLAGSQPELAHDDFTAILKLVEAAAGTQVGPAPRLAERRAHHFLRSPAMSKSENDALEAMLRSRPKALDTPRRREAYDALGTLFPLAADVRTEALALGRAVRGDRHRRRAGRGHGRVPAWRRLCLWLAAQPSASRLGTRPRGRCTRHRRRLPARAGSAFPAALDDALAVWRALLDSGLAPRQIALAGDSAGGGLAVALMVRLRELGLAQPAGTVLFSPWVDMLASGASYTENARRDPVVHRGIINFCARQYIGENLEDAPLASPVRADLRGLAPLVIFAGATETLLDDSIALARAAGIADVAVRLEIWPGMFHIWPSYFQMLEEGRRALTVAGAALQGFLAPPS